MMKKPGKFVTNATLALCGSSMLLASCDGFFVDDDMIHPSQLPDVGESSIEIKFNQEDQAYLTFLNKLGFDIIQNPEVAQEFAKDPQKYVEKYGYHEKVDLDENMLNYVLALGDPDINEAIKQNNIETVVRLMREKCLVTNNFTKIKLTPEQITQLNAFYAQSSKNKMCTSEARPEQAAVAIFALAVWVFVALVEDIIAGYNVGLALNIGLAVNVAVKAKVKVSGTQPPKPRPRHLTSMTLNKIAVQSNLAFKAITAKAPEKNAYVLADQYIEDFSTDVVNAIATEVPEALQGLSKEEIRNLIKYNMYLKNK